MEIMTDEAFVVTAQVEIRALTVRGKQVTLAVFRQLIEEPPSTSLGIHRSSGSWASAFEQMQWYSHCGGGIGYLAAASMSRS